MVSLPIVIAGVLATWVTLAARNPDPAFELEQRQAISR